MRVLLIEDEIAKEKDILKHLKDIQLDDVTVRHSITSGIAEIRENDFDYILLDMSLPIFDTDDAAHFDDNEFETFGGNFVLEELDRIDYHVKVIVITAFDILGEGTEGWNFLFQPMNKDTYPEIIKILQDLKASEKKNIELAEQVLALN